MGQEKIIIVVLSYIIGFTTAYIVYGPHTHENVVVREKTHKQADMWLNDGDNPAAAVNAWLDDKGLFVTSEYGEAVVSGTLNEGTEPGPGFHTAIPAYAVSPSGAYLYYCEQTSADENTCTEYIYDLATHHAHILKFAGESIPAPIQNQDFQWVDGDKVVYNNYTSVLEPWNLVKVE